MRQTRDTAREELMNVDARNPTDGQSEEQIHVEGRMHCREDNIEMDTKDKRYQGGWSQDVSRDRGQWRAVVNTVMNLEVTEKAGNCLDYLS
jgi:hypothetical protein